MRVILLWKSLKKIESTVRDEDIKKGRIEGIKERNYSIAKNMLKDNLDFRIIAKYTGLSEDEIKNIKL